MENGTRPVLTISDSFIVEGNRKINNKNVSMLSKILILIIS